jgi:undecaprenyl-diphosphatase
MCRLSAALASAFVLLTVLVDTGVTAGLDRRGMNHLAPLAGSNWTLLATAADPIVTAALFGAAFLVLRSRGATTAAWAWIAALAIGLLVEVVCKAAIDQIAFSPEERVFDLFSLAKSFPSGHAMRAVLLAGVGTAVAPRYARIWIAYAAFVGVWVVVSGMHLVSDAVGGVLLGAALVAAVNCRWPTGRVRRAGVVD